MNVSMSTSQEQSRVIITCDGCALRDNQPMANERALMEIVNKHVAITGHTVTVQSVVRMTVRRLNDATDE